MIGLSNFQFTATICGIVAAILGMAAIIANAFKSGRRETCMAKFTEQERKLDEVKSEEKKSVALSDQRFGYIEAQLKDIKEWQITINSKIERIFEIVNKLPKRVINGKEG